MTVERSYLRDMRLNNNLLRNSFKRSENPNHHGYEHSIPQGLGIIEVHEGRKGKVIGCSNGFIFYGNHYPYISARFNINDYSADYDAFLLKIETMFSVLHHLNKRRTSAYNVKLILEHIKENGSYVFNARQMYMKVRGLEYNPALVRSKKRDYVVTEYRTFANKIGFLNALNGARRAVNSNHNLKELFCLFEERISNEDYGYINEAIVIGQRKNNQLVYAMIMKFNLLCTGMKRQRRKQVKSEPLYNSSVKRITLKSMSLKPQQQNAFVVNQVRMYERELKTLNRLTNNREIVQQMFLILDELTGFDSDTKIVPDLKIQRRLKAQLINLVEKKNSKRVITQAAKFDIKYKKSLRKGLPLMINLATLFDTDLTNSVFNQVTIEEAFYRGEIFWKDYNEFHNTADHNGSMNFGIKISH